MDINLLIFILNSLHTIFINFSLQPKLKELFPDHQQQIDIFFVIYSILINYINFLQQ